MDATEQADTATAESETSAEAAAATIDTPTADGADTAESQADDRTQASADDTTPADASDTTSTTDGAGTTSADAAEAPTAEAMDATFADGAGSEATTQSPVSDTTVAGGADEASASADEPDVAAQASPEMTAQDVSDTAVTSGNIDMADEGTADLTPQPEAGNGAAPAEAVSEAAEAPALAPRAPRPTYEGPEPTTMEELLNEQATEIRSLKHGDVVEGNVVRIDKDEILVDIGAKSEGVISNRELYGKNAETQPQLNIGDQVLVYVLQPESPEGHAVQSLRRAGLERKWRAMQEQLDAGAIIEAPVIDHNKGGLIVDCGIRGFVPISQIVDFPRRPQNEQPRDAAQEIAEKLQPYVGRKLRLKILEVNRKANRLILSEKVALYEERREKRDELFSSLQVGQKVTGTVRSIAPFGVFVDLGGIDGLVHKSELSWNKVNNPEAGYRVGEEVEAEVIDINHERGRISLSIRRLQPDPWHSTVADLKVGDVIDGTVTKIVNFGAFVRVRDGLEGLIHISELSHARVAHPGDVVHEGQTLKLKIISLDQERHRLGLSLKQAEEAPARPEPAAPRERRPRGGGERGYDMSQAVQEPEGGIDNTLAAAFAQVRQQMQETEALRASTGAEESDGEAVAADEQPTADEQARAEAPDAVAQAVAQETAEPAIEAETADAPALEVAASGGATAGVAEPQAETPGGDAETSGGETSAAETETAPESAEQEARPTRKGRTAGGKGKETTSDGSADGAAPDATAESDGEAPAESATEPVAEATATEPVAEAQAESVAESTAASESEGSADSGDAASTDDGDVAPEATDPAEGADDAAPAEGADTEEPTA